MFRACVFVSWHQIACNYVHLAAYKHATITNLLASTQLQLNCLPACNYSQPICWQPACNYYLQVFCMQLQPTCLTACMPSQPTTNLPVCMQLQPTVWRPACNHDLQLFCMQLQPSVGLPAFNHNLLLFCMQLQPTCLTACMQSQPSTCLPVCMQLQPTIWLPACISCHAITIYNNSACLHATEANLPTACN